MTLQSWQTEGHMNQEDVSVLVTTEFKCTVCSEASPQLQNSLGKLNQMINHLKAQGYPLDILTTCLEQEIRTNSSKYNKILANKNGNEVFY